MSTHVKCYDVHTRTYSEIPAAELAPGMIRTRDDKTGVEAYISADQLELSNAAPKDLTAEFETVALAVLDILRPHITWADEERWMYLFRTERNPRRELAMWMWVAAVYVEMTHAGKDAAAVKQDVFAVLAQSMNDHEHVLETVQLRRISRARAREIIARHNSPTALDELLDFWSGRVGDDVLVRLFEDKAA